MDQYLEVLQLDWEEPDGDFLRKISRHHQMYIPFENLGLHYGRKRDLQIEHVFDKVVGRGRGGFSFELNGLLYHLLVYMNFDATLLGGSHFYPRLKKFSPDIDHMIIGVRQDQQWWLVDVGSADGMVYPKVVQENFIQLDLNRYYTFAGTVEKEWILRKSNDTVNYHPVYKFLIKPRNFIEFFNKDQEFQSRGNLPFLPPKIISKLTKEGRIILTDLKLTYWRDQKVHTQRSRNRKGLPDQARAAFWGYQSHAGRFRPLRDDDSF